MDTSVSGLRLFLPPVVELDRELQHQNRIREREFRNQGPVGRWIGRGLDPTGIPDGASVRHHVLHFKDGRRRHSQIFTGNILDNKKKSQAILKRLPSLWNGS